MGISIDEKRVYDASEGPTPVFVAGEFGVARVNTSDDLVGEFGLALECTARDAAGSRGRVAVATDEDVLVGVASEDGTAAEGGIEFEALGVGPAVAVGYAGGDLLVAREDGAVVRSDDETAPDDTGRWLELADSDDPLAVRAIDGEFVAAESGVYRATATDLQHVGLDDARDVAAGTAPLAATDDGLYRLGNGWLDELAGAFRAVSAPGAGDAGPVAGDATGRLGWAHAASADGRLFAREDDEWSAVDLPVEGQVVALAHGERDTAGEGDGQSGGAYAVTEDGTFLLSVGDGWNHRVLGLRGVRAVAAP